MEITGPVIRLLSCLCVKIVNNYNKQKRIKENKESLKRKMDELRGKAEDVKTQLQRTDMQPGMEPKREVQVWHANVEKLNEEVEGILLIEKSGCLNGILCCYHSRLKLAKSVERMLNKVIEYQEKSNFSNGLFIHGVLDTGKTLPTAELYCSTTTQKTSDRIWDSLKATTIQRIGIYGMGGVGKTTMMKQINNHLQKEIVFDHVIWVTVSNSKDSSLKRLQRDIAKEIRIEFTEDDDEHHRSLRIYAALVHRHFLLILDDMWKAFPLDKIGIPAPSRDNNCKIIISARNKNVCNQMETQRNIEVKVLPEEEAWDLFKGKVEERTMVSSELEVIAKLVVKECGGLPLALITVGRALRQVHDLRVWRNALKELKCSTTEIEGMEDTVFESLRFSYTRLRNDQLKACFLYCALYPEDYEIPTMELVKYWVYEGLINGMRISEEEIDKGYAIMNELKDAFLLESLHNKAGVECVKMHDLIRDMAINITTVSHLFLVKAGFGLKELPVLEDWMEDMERISLMNNNIQVLSGEPKCPKLSTLFLQQNCCLKRISPSFFDHMHSLRVLNLSYTRIECLPQSLCNLENLRALLFHYCYDLKRLPPLTKLKSLRFLDLYYTRIEVLPEGMEELVNLQHLNLSRTFSLSELPVGVIRNLSLLEDLFMYQSKYRWCWNSLQVEGGANIEEIIKSTHLTNLYVHFVDLPSFEVYVKSEQWRMLKSFHLIVGQVSDLSPPDISKSKYIVAIGGCHMVNSEKPLVLPSNTLCLTIENCNDIVGFSELKCLLDLNGLKECHIFRCKDIEYIVMEENKALTTLKTLELWDLPKLTSIWKGVLHHDTLKCLEILKVDGCHSLKNLFSAELLKHLQNIEEIQVENCKMMEEMIVGAEESLTLPRLRTLELECLPNLKSVFSGACVCNSLQTIHVMKCPKLKEVPLVTGRPPLALKAIRGSRKWWNALNWNDPQNKISLEEFYKEKEEEDECSNDNDDDEI